MNSLIGVLLSSTIGYSYFAPYYPMTHHPCSTPVFSFNCTSVQLLLYTSSAAMVHCRHHLFGYPFSYIYRGPSALQNKQSSYTTYLVQQLWAQANYCIFDLKLRLYYSCDYIIVAIILLLKLYCRRP